MTADVEMLPCPFCGGEAHLERQGHVCCKTRFCRGAGAFDNYGTAKEQNASAVARWNTRATAAKDAEIEALRAELDRLRGEHVRVRRDRNAAEARAERLAEALRGMVGFYGERVDAECRTKDWRELEAIEAARAALRDHDQEGKDG